LGSDFLPQLSGLSQVDVEVRTGKYDEAALLGDWEMQSGIQGKISDFTYDASGWKKMRGMPRLWNGNDDPILSNFLGAVWFRKEIELPAQLAAEPAELSFGGLDDADVTWVNGVKVGETMRLGQRTYAVPPGVLKPGRNVIATWVLNTAGGGGMTGKAEELNLKFAGGTSISLAGEWQFQVQQPLDQLPPRLFSIRHDAGWPSVLFNGMVAPLTAFKIKGVLWYQGEANVGRAAQYKKLLALLISDWRLHWEQGDFPFLIVQLAGFGPPAHPQPTDSALAELRNAQAEVASKVPNVGLATAVDLGDPNDLHPSNKQEVGRRLALVALEKFYARPIESSGPCFESMKIEGDAIRVKFAHSVGLTSKNGTPQGFALGGADNKFVWANAKIEGDTVLLSHPQVTHPSAVRYAWSDNPMGNIYNAAGLPAYPFRAAAFPIH